MDHKATIEQFYKSFSELNSKGMNACYHEDVTFSDPAFGTLHGQNARDMWTMLCIRANNFKVEYSNIQSSGDTGSAHWEANYLFGEKERPVHNIIESSFEFKDGKIFKHTDVFNAHRWAKQAMGLPGLLLGGTKFFQNKVQKSTSELLKKFQAKKG